MKIKTIELHSNDLAAQKYFYHDKLGLEIHDEKEDRFSIHIGWSILTFKASKEKHPYHYCFLIPSNKLELAYEWFKNRIPMIEFEAKNFFPFESWNAKSFYFYDGNGNVAECIVRYDLHNSNEGDFNLSDLLCVNEIGMPSANIKKSNNYLEKSIGSFFSKGNFERFATNGDNEGLFLLVNNDVKKIWFPTEVLTSSSPFLANIETEKGLFNLKFSNQEMSVNRIE